MNMRLIPLLCLALGATQSLAQQGIVRGRVLTKAAGRPVPEAEVVLTEAGRTIRVDTAGRFEFRGVRSGTITLRIRALGYASQVVGFDITSGQQVDRLIALEPTVTTLAGVDVTAA